MQEHEALVEFTARETESYSHQIPELIRKNAVLIDEKLAAIRVCDPAVGSGAFPVGMMTEIVRARQVLQTWTKTGKTPYDLKRECIENSLYGVDIDAGAVEIAKLRLWLSLVVDEDDPLNIKPLPNLDYKVLCGNSLFGLPNGVLLDSQLQARLEEHKKKYFYITDPNQKRKIRIEINILFSQLLDSAKQYTSNLDEINFDFQTHFSEVFHEKGGFDVVIANPPYISHDKYHYGKNLLKAKFRSFEPFADIYCYFIEKGIGIQNKRGLLSYITSNSYLRADYGLPLRKLLLKEVDLLMIVNLDQAQLFEDAIVNVAILLTTKNRKDHQCFIFSRPYLGDISKFAEYITANGFLYKQNIFDAKSWSLIEPDMYFLKRKLRVMEKPLNS